MCLCASYIKLVELKCSKVHGSLNEDDFSANHL